MNSFKGNFLKFNSFDFILKPMQSLQDTFTQNKTLFDNCGKNIIIIKHFGLKSSSIVYIWSKKVWNVIKSSWSMLA